jgi:hypothetical protein
MKIRSLAPLAVACLALLTPRLVTSGGAFGGGIGEAKLACDSKNINHACSGNDCTPIVTSEATNNNSEKYYVEGTTTTECTQRGRNCIGRATAPNNDCEHKHPPASEPELDPVLNIDSDL